MLGRASETGEAETEAALSQAVQAHWLPSFVQRAGLPTPQLGYRLIFPFLDQNLGKKA